MASTTLTVFGSSITGFVPAGGIDEGEDVERVQMHETFGLDGATAITGGLNPKDIRISVHLSGLASEGALNGQVTALRQLTGRSGTVTVSGKRNLSWSDTLLLRVEDSGSGAMPNPADGGKWHQEITLRFVQLR